MLNAAMTTSIMKSVATGVTILHSSALQMLKQKSYVITFSCIRQRQSITSINPSMWSFAEQKNSKIEAT